MTRARARASPELDFGVSRPEQRCAGRFAFQGQWGTPLDQPLIRAARKRRGDSRKDGLVDHTAPPSGGAFLCPVRPQQRPHK